MVAVPSLEDADFASGIMISFLQIIEDLCIWGYTPQMNVLYFPNISSSFEIQWSLYFQKSL